MKKLFKRILGIIFALILGYQQFCYADVVIPGQNSRKTLITPGPLFIPTISESSFVPITIVVCLIVVIILMIAAISFFCLKATVRKQDKSENNNKH